MDIILTQRFLPERGGSIQWLVNLFREHLGELKVITNRYSEPSHNPFPNAQLIQGDIMLTDWGITSIPSIIKYFRMWKLLRKELVSGEVNYIHCSKILPEGLVAVVTKLLTWKKVKIICFAHGEEFKAYNSSRQLKLIYKLIIKNIDLVVANSNYTKGQLLNLSSPQKIEILHPCINLEELESKYSKEELRLQYGFNNNDIILLTVGRLTPRKNQLGVLKAIISNHLEKPSIKYIIIGSGEQEAELRKVIKDHQLEARVQILTNITDEQKKDYYHLSDIFVMPSINTGFDLEGFGMVYVEAQACGLRIICGKSGGELEAIKVDLTGTAVSNQQELEMALCKFIDNHGLDQSALAKEFAKQFATKPSYKSYQDLVISNLC